MVLKAQLASESPGRLAEHRLQGPTDSGGLPWGPRIANESPGGVDAAGLGDTFSESMTYFVTG